MGNSDSKLHFRKAVIQLTTKTQPVEASEDVFWDQFWTDINLTAQDIFALVPAAEIRAVREESPSNLATLCYKAVERLVLNADSGCVCERERQAVLSCVRLLTRILPYIFEDPDWRGFFWSTVPKVGKSLDGPSGIQSIDSCEFIWEAGVGFAQTPPLNHTHDFNRTELLKLLLTCFSEEMYQSPSDTHTLNPWVSFFCSRENRHALPLFTSLLNVVCAYDPVGYGIPYNHLMFSDQRGVLAELALQTLIVSLEQELVDNSNTSTNLSTNTDTCSADYKKNTTAEGCQATRGENLFVNYLSRIHREELANLPTDVISIQKALQKKSRSNSTHNAVFTETSNPYNTACSEGPYKTTPVQTGTLNASLKDMPRTGLTDESEILKFLQHGTLVGLLPVPHPILIRKYQANEGTALWFRTYMWGIIYLRNVDPPVWYDTDVKLFEIQRI
ncbi:protein HID1-like [Sinocyclocheilus grahami]|uniref:protein HID1-like n=1 Tax=Sinocyclocheilus grahami TaxID=75366 RepID=UPI0007AC6E5D|nr:PREDICTED: protein HID1-like [Sinocyclocheilus grahami]